MEKRQLTNSHKGLKVKVYFNLHKKCFSVKDYRTGLVIGHTNRVVLEDCEFRVSEAGRQRVIRERKKNVHAFVIGTLKAWDDQSYWTAVNHVAYYNPYETSTFMVDGEPIYRSEQVVLQDKKVFVKSAKVIRCEDRFLELRRQIRQANIKGA